MTNRFHQISMPSALKQNKPAHSEVKIFKRRDTTFHIVIDIHKNYDTESDLKSHNVQCAVFTYS